MENNKQLSGWLDAAFYSILHIVVAILCIIVYSKIDTVINALGSAAGEIQIMNITILFAAISNFVSAAAVMIREYKRQKLEEQIKNLQKSIEECKDSAKYLENKFEKMTNIKCPKCGKTYPQGTKFCQDCGKNLTETNMTKDENYFVFFYYNSCLCLNAFSSVISSANSMLLPMAIP